MKTAGGEERAILWDVVEEHLDEAEFLWGRWERSLDSPLYGFAEAVEREERRLVAHVEGLIAGGEAVAERLLYPALEENRPRVAAASLALLGSEHGDELPPVLDELVKTEEDAQLEGLARALETAPRDDIGAALAGTLASTSLSTVCRARVLRAIAFRRAGAVDALKPSFTDAEPAVRKGAVLAARCPDGQRLRGFVMRALSAEELEVREAAVETGLVLGMRSAWEVALELGKAGHARALLALALLGGEAERDMLLAALKKREGALFAAGFSGWKAIAEVCIPLLADEKLGGLAGEAFCAITGFDPAEAEVKRPEPPSPDELEDDDLEADLVPGADDGLPLLDPEKVSAWWKTAQKRFDPKVRYLGGQPWSAETIRGALEDGPTRRRHAVAFAVAVRTKGRVDIEPRALAETQRRQLGSVTDAELTQPIGRALS